jgi:hypothetical protein
MIKYVKYTAMKKPYLILLFSIMVSSSFSQIFRGVITELESSKTIAYTSIGVLHKQTGVLSDSYGVFNMDISAFEDNDTLRVSAIGYERVDFLIEHCKAYFVDSEPVIIQLVPIPQIQEEVLVIASKRKRMTAGNNVRSQMIVAGFQNSKRGSELGTVLKYKKKKKGRIISLNFNVVCNPNDSLKFRINLYEMLDGLPDKTILATPIYFHNTPKDGMISIDLSEMNIYIRGNAFVSIESIEDINAEGLFFKSAFLRSPSFKRSAPQADWKKAMVDLGFWAEIIYKK